MKPRIWFTSHSSPPVLWPVTRTSTNIPFGQVGPIIDLYRLVGQRKLVEAVLGIEPLHKDLNLRADLRGHVEQPQRNDPLLAAAELDEDVVAANGGHPAALQRLGLKGRLVALRSEIEQSVHRVAAHRPAQLVFQLGGELCGRSAA